MYELTLAQKEMIQNNFDLSMAQLKNIIGMSDPVQLDPDLNYSVEDDQTLNASENKTYKMLLSQSNFNKQNADYEEAGFYPDVQLVGSIKNNLLGYDEEKFSVLEDYANPDFFNYSLGLQLNWSIFSGGNTSAKIKQLSTTSRLQERQASIMKLEIEAQLEVLLKNLKAISALIKAQETYASSLKLNLESVRIEYQNGQSSLGDVVVSEKNYSEAKSNLLKHKKSWVISKLNADKLSGRPINGEL
jgi:outer membrane protein TolC